MNKEDADAMSEQQSREIRNMNNVRMNERNRIIKLIEKRRWACLENQVVLPDEKEKYEEMVNRFDELILAINSPSVQIANSGGKDGS